MPASNEWARVATLEDLMAHLATIDLLARVIRTQAWRQGDWETVFERADGILAETTQLRAAMSARWDSLVSEASK